MVNLSRSRQHQRHYWQYLATLPGLLLLLFTVSACAEQAPDVTERLQRLGNPMATDGKTGRARNVWDLQAFGGKIYVAGGSTVTNAGPINVWAFNPKTQTLEKEYQVKEEAIEQFRVFDNQLYIPAADPRHSDAHKFYRRGLNTPWKLHRSKAVALAHVRDLIKTPTGDILMVGNNRRANNAAVPATAITRDDGQSFQGAGLAKAPQSQLNWFFSVFAYQGKIFASSALLRDDANRPGVISVYNPKRRRFERANLSTTEFIPDVQVGPQIGRHGKAVLYRLWQPFEYQGSLVYAARSYSLFRQTYAASYLNSLGFFVKRKLGITPQSVVFPDGQAVGEDALVQESWLYVLTNTKISAAEHWVRVYRTDQPNRRQAWQEVLRFKSPNKARSFEYLEGVFYFGLGQDDGEPLGDAGTLLKVVLEDKGDR